MNLTMKNLINCFTEAKKLNMPYVGVRIRMEGFPEDEFIINKAANIDSKLEYYKNAYNDNLALKFNNNIQIVGMTFGESFEDIEKDLL